MKGGAKTFGFAFTVAFEPVPVLPFKLDVDGLFALNLKDGEEFVRIKRRAVVPAWAPENEAVFLARRTAFLVVCRFFPVLFHSAQVFMLIEFPEVHSPIVANNGPISALAIFPLETPQFR